MSEKALCLVCGKERTKKTLQRYAGKCGRCVINKSDVKVDSIVHGPVEVTKTQRKKIWKTYQEQIEANDNMCLLCNENLINYDTASIGYNKSQNVGGELAFDNCMPICRQCAIAQRGYSFAEFKALKRVIVPPKCVICKKPEFKYTYKCCDIKLCESCVKSDYTLSDGFATLYCPNKKCKKEVSMTNAMLY